MNEMIAMLTVIAAAFGLGFLLSTPIMKNQYRKYLEDQRSWEETDRNKTIKMNSLRGKIDKLKGKLKKKKK